MLGNPPYLQLRTRNRIIKRIYNPRWVRVVSYVRRKPGKSKRERMNSRSENEMPAWRLLNLGQNHRLPASRDPIRWDMCCLGLGEGPRGARCWRAEQEWNLLLGWHLGFAQLPSWPIVNLVQRRRNYRTEPKLPPLWWSTKWTKSLHFKQFIYTHSVFKSLSVLTFKIMFELLYILLRFIYHSRYIKYDL
jgi:hypothetical protein